MIHTIKNYKWIIATSLICIVFGLLTFFTFTNQSFITLKDFNLKILLSVDLILLALFFGLIIYETYKILSKKKRKKLGSKVNLKYIIYFSSTTLLPSIIIAIFSLILFNVGLQRYFDDKIKSVVNNSAELAENYVEQTRNSIETDILLMILDVNSQSALYYENPKRFLNLLTTSEKFFNFCTSSFVFKICEGILGSKFRLKALITLFNWINSSSLYRRISSYRKKII